MLERAPGVIEFSKMLPKSRGNLMYTVRAIERFGSDLGEHREIRSDHTAEVCVFLYAVDRFDQTHQSKSDLALIFFEFGFHLLSPLRYPALGRRARRPYRPSVASNRTLIMLRWNGSARSPQMGGRTPLTPANDAKMPSVGKLARIAPPGSRVS